MKIFAVEKLTKDMAEDLAADILSVVIMNIASKCLTIEMVKYPDLGNSVMDIPGSNSDYFTEKLAEFIISSLEQREAESRNETYKDIGIWYAENLKDLIPDVRAYALHLLKTYDREKGGKYTAALDR